MKNKLKGRAYVITGPTASGKSALAVCLAKKLNTDIISADSRQIYKGIPIATAVPETEERDGVTHHLMEILPLEASYNAYNFENDALQLAIDTIEEKGSVVVCGGSMLYIDSFCNGIDRMPDVPEELRKRLEKEWINKGNDWLLNYLERVDPVSFHRIDLQNMKRVFHAVEVSLAAEKPYSSFLGGEKIDRPFFLSKICLQGDRSLLFDKINSRVLKMIDKGLLEEAKKVYSKRDYKSLDTVGLKEMFAYLEGTFTLEETIGRIGKNTRVYAKKQMTWHKKYNGWQFLDFETMPAVNAEIILKESKSSC